ncbi:MAG: hypothetical protein AAB873_02400 [Patescibacteria group bacterium]
MKKFLGASLLVTMMMVLGFGSAAAYGGPFDPMAHLLSMRATVEAFPGSTPDEKKLLNRIDNMIALAGKKNKLDKAERKMERVANDMEKKLGKKKGYKYLTDAQAALVLSLANEFIDNI